VVGVDVIEILMDVEAREEILHFTVP